MPRFLVAVAQSGALAVILCCAVAGRAHGQEKPPCAATEDAVATQACEKEVERELERIYLVILNAIRPGFPALLNDAQLPRQRTLFANAQSAWKVFRDRGCEADAFENFDYSGYASVVARCRITITRERIEQLRSGPWGAVLDPAGEVTSVEARAGSTQTWP